MNNNVFKKKLSQFGGAVQGKLDELFDGATRTADEFLHKFRTMSEKNRAQAVKIAGGALLSLVVLCGFTGCVDENGVIDETSSQVTTISSEEITTISNSYAETTEPGEETSTPGAETTGPAATSGSETKPPETTVEPVTTEPVGGEETSDPVATPPEETTGPESSEVTTADPGTENPDEGYEYPKFFTDKVVEYVVARGALSGSGYYYEAKELTPEIVFVERGVSSIEESCPIVIYARYDIPFNNEVRTIYTRFAITVNSRDYIALGKPSKYSSYDEYINKIIEAIKSKEILVSAEVSELETRQVEANNKIGEKFAKFIDNRFVDAEINFVRNIYPKGENGYTEISGFGYDTDGIAYSFVAEVEFKSIYWGIDEVVGLIESGEAVITNRKDVTVAAINSVFVSESTSER